MNKQEYIAQIFESELSANARLVTLAIMRYLNNKSLMCYPSLQTIASDCALCKNTVMAAVKEAQEAGFFEIKKARPKGSRFTVNNYVFWFDRPSGEPSNEPLFDPSIDPSIDRSNERSSGAPELIRTIRTIETKEKNTKKKASELEIEPPEWLDKVAWQEYCLHRKQKKEPINELSASKAFAKLQTCKDPVAEINRSILNGWIGIFPEKHNIKTAQIKSTAPNVRDLIARGEMI